MHSVSCTKKKYLSVDSIKSDSAIHPQLFNSDILHLRFSMFADIARFTNACIIITIFIITYYILQLLEMIDQVDDLPSNSSRLKFVKAKMITLFSST